MASPLEDVLISKLSVARISNYLYACDDDLSAAITLYVWNSQISAAFLEVLGVVEVVVRNAWHQELTKLSLRLNGNE
jgi:hypothetical protein